MTKQPDEQESWDVLKRPKLQPPTPSDELDELQRSCPRMNPDELRRFFEDGQEVTPDYDQINQDFAEQQGFGSIDDYWDSCENS